MLCRKLLQFTADHSRLIFNAASTSPVRIAFTSSRFRALRHYRTHRMVDAIPTKMEKLIFLGTSAGRPQKHRNVTSQALLLSSGRVWMLDCGEGTQHQVEKCPDFRSGKLDLILITHLHGDHCFGLPGFLCSLSLGARDKPLRIIGPAGVKQLVEGVLSISQSYLCFELEYTELHPGRSYDLGFVDDIEIFARPLNHRAPCHGYVLQEKARRGKVDMAKAKALGLVGKQVGAVLSGEAVQLADGTMFSDAAALLGPAPRPKKIILLGDTCDSSTVVDKGMECDLLVHECTFAADMASTAIDGGHSTSAMAGAFAHEVKAKHLILTHFSSRYCSAKADGVDEDPEVDLLVQEAHHHCPNTVVSAAKDFLVVNI